ncbi:MAG: hypothetical protein ACRD2L_21450 [Terriglobia bacterium]
MRRVVILSAALLLLVACAQSSGILKLGPDTYTVSVHAAPARGGEPGARGLALTEAQSHCQSQDREILVTNLSSGRSTHLPGGTVEVTFRCLAKGDPELQRPTFRKAPDITIEDRRDRN